MRTGRREDGKSNWKGRKVKKEKKHRETILQYQEKVYNDLAGSADFSEGAALDDSQTGDESDVSDY